VADEPHSEGAPASDLGPAASVLARLFGLSAAAELRCGVTSDFAQIHAFFVCGPSLTDLPSGRAEAEAVWPTYHSAMVGRMPRKCG
jgi:hypothetical protein